MTNEQRKELQKIGKRLQLLFPGFYGSMKFNLAVGKPVNVNLSEGVDITVNENVKL